VILPHLSGIHEIDVRDMHDTPTGHVGHRPEPRAVQQSTTAWLPRQNDLFHARVPVPFIRQVLQVMQDTPQHTYQVLTKRSRRLRRLDLEWPANLWMGVSVENADVLGRVDDLRQVPAAVRFLSCEPLLGSLYGIDLGSIHWVIAGGESGPRARPMDPQWAADLRDVCQQAQVPFFFKQWGGRTPRAGGRLLNGRTYDEMPERLAASA
jgi:protein gp37